MRGGFGLGLAQRVGLRFAAAFGHGFSEVCEEHGEPEPQGDLQVEAEAGLVRDGVVDEQNGGEDAADLDDEHDGILDHLAGIELDERIDRGLTHDCSIPETVFFSMH